MLALFASVALGVPPPELRLHLGKVPMKGRTICYPSGLQVHAVQRPNTGIVSVSTVIDGGQAAEQVGERGAAHLAEHLWSQARAIGGVPVDQTLAGLVHDAVTLPDATVWVTVAAPDDLRFVLPLEGQRLLDPLNGVDEAVFQAERAKVHNETLWRGEHAVRRATRELEDGLWPTGFVYRGLIGRVEDNDALTLEAVRAYVDRTWVPAATTIRIEGEIDLASVDSILEALPVELRLGEAKAECSHPPVGDPPAPAGGPPVEVKAGVLEPQIVFGWSLPAGYGPTDVVGRAAAGWTEIRLRSELASTGLRVSCDYEPRRRASVLTCRTPLGTALTAGQAIVTIQDHLRDLWVGDLTTRAEWVEELVSALDDALIAADSYDDASLVERALFSHYSGGKFDPMTEALDEVLAFEEGALVELGRKHLTASRMVAVSVVPGQVPVEERSGRIEAMAGLGAPKAGPWVQPAPEFDGWTTQELDNGLVVWIVPHPGGAPMSIASVGFPAGGSVGAPGAAEVQLARWSTRLPLSFADLVDATATTTTTEVGSVHTAVTALGPSGNLDAQLYLVNQLAVSPAVGPAEVVPRGPLDPEARAARDRLERLFPGHPLSRGDAVDLPKGKDAKAWRSGVLRPEDAALVVVGWVDPAEAAALATTYFGGWKAPKSEPMALPPPPPAQDRSLHAFRADSTLASLRVSCRTPVRTGKNDAALDLAAFLLDQGMSQSLRENGGTYLADARAVDLGSAGGLIELETAVGPGEAADALSAIYGLVELVGNGPPEEVLQWARRGVLAQLARTLASTRSTWELAMRAAGSGLDLDDLRGYPVRVGTVDGLAIREVLQGCVDHEAATYVGPTVDLAPYEPVWVGS